MTPIDALSLAPAAFLAGVLMFLAPCTLPIVPGFLAFIAGVPSGRVQKNIQKRVVVNAIAFTVGFSVAFIILGVFAGFLGALLGPWRSLISRGAGALIILFGLTVLGVVRLPGLSNEFHIKTPRFITVGRPESSFLIGTLFALGWSPCIGPILGTVLLFAGTSATALQGALLLAIFSLGLAVPFMISAVLVGQVGEVFVRWGRMFNMFSIVGGCLLVVFGIVMLTDNLALTSAWLNSVLSFMGYERLLNYL